MNSEPKDPFLPTLTQKEKANKISLTALQKRVGGFVICLVVNCIFRVPNERKPILKRDRRANHKNDKSKSLKHNANISINDPDIFQVIVNTNDEMSVIDSSNVSICDSDKVPLNDYDMDHNSEYVQPSKRHSAKISVKLNFITGIMANSGLLISGSFP
ncbi:hypothetical protein AVEN_173648-1 [Araneus ventricosus]|uniref:Uncharacterized protein n=1 Tax=Araneus ventricosus TaxID=182803 RepID=A0A4Y2TLC6_ARAVE|nr:hypothetical protein AVEN_173648-1 [Araneus ventricosus]